MSIMTQMKNGSDVVNLLPAISRNELELELPSAIARGDVFFVHQPQVDLRDGRVVGVEALIRWEHPQRGLLLPGAFLPDLQSDDSLNRITHFAVESALRQWQRWHAKGLQIPIAVNVTPLILSNREFPEWVASSLAEAGLPGGMLKLELTEETLISDGKRAAEVIDFLVAHGVDFSIDDFGAGYSSLSHLLDFDVREVKIDRCFVEAMPSDPRASRIVGALARLCNELDVTVVGEGVSSPAIATALLEAGCAVGQGFHLGRPMRAVQIPGLAPMASLDPVPRRPAPGSDRAQRPRPHDSPVRPNPSPRRLS